MRGLEVNGWMRKWGMGGGFVQLCIAHQQCNLDHAVYFGKIKKQTNKYGRACNKKSMQLLH